jgi:prophage maintenance system killer protein
VLSIVVRTEPSSADATGQDAYPSLDAKAAALLHSLARNHALIEATNGSRSRR